MKARFLAAALALYSTALHAQTIDDGLMMGGKQLCTGFSYYHDGWSEYWEGTLKRDNENVGDVTTESVAWMATYGVTDDFNVIAMLPYVWTHASGGTLHGQKGVQDLTVAAKYRLLGFGGDRGQEPLRLLAVASFGVPLTDYVPDLLPLSIGLASRRLSGRMTLTYRAGPGWYGNATAAYTWRSNVTLDRPAYFTDGQLFLTDQVQMPDLFDYSFSAGYSGRRLYVPITYSQHHTRGGGDIRRQDMPFVSNRMNSSRLDALVMYRLPKVSRLALRLEAGRTLTGRNVGESTTVGAGLMYLTDFAK
jgi:outer membrane putative beta-barrel porin/alpha-amylase